jgi:rhomboid protease GluP
MKAKLHIKSIMLTKFALCTLLIIFILDFFVLVSSDTNILSINHLIFGNEWGLLTDYGRLLNIDNINGQWWRIVTTIFLHAGIPHLLVNMIALWISGDIVENKIKKPMFLTLLLVSGVISSICTMFVTNGAVGASGVIYGIVGAMIVIFIKDREYVKHKMSMIKWSLIILYLTLPNLSGTATIIAHVSGLFSGMLFTLLCKLQYVENDNNVNLS